MSKIPINDDNRRKYIEEMYSKLSQYNIDLSKDNNDKKKYIKSKKKEIKAMYDNFKTYYPEYSNKSTTNINNTFGQLTIIKHIPDFLD